MTKKQTLEKRDMTRRQRARREKDIHIQRILTWSAVALVGLIVIIIGFGVVNEYVIKAQRPVATVGDTSITAKTYQARVRYERAMMQVQLNQYQNILAQLNPNDPEQQAFYQQIEYTASNMESQLAPEMATLFGGQVLDQMIEEELIRQEASKRGIVISEDDIEQEVEMMMGYDRTIPITETETLTGTQAPVTEAEYQEIYQTFQENILQLSNFSEAQYRQMLAAGLLQQQLQAAMTEEVEAVAEQVEVVYFAAGTEELAGIFQERLNSGEDHEALLEEVRNDEDDQSLGQTLPWFPQDYLSSQFGPDFAQVAFNTPVGQASEPFQIPETDMGYFVLYVLGHEEQPLSEQLLAEAGQTRYAEWVDAQMAEKVERLDWQSALPEE